jgi:hypothetical protein
MNDPLRLSEDEWNLVTQLLQQELDELPVEIHHTRSAQVREELSRRRDLVRGLLARLRPMPVV